MPSELSSKFDINLYRFENGLDADNDINTVKPVLDISAVNEEILPCSFQNVETPENVVPDKSNVLPQRETAVQKHEDEE